jgi:2-polyprenyl-3-methyl-5-hydroxy-6-metoxy-1,4-benzoquinol methylase
MGSFIRTREATSMIRQENTMFATKDDVIACYQYILGREPESEAAIQDHLRKKISLVDLRYRFINSAEFINKRAIESDSAPARYLMPIALPSLEIEHSVTSDQLAQCIENIKDAWSHLGEVRAHFSVLTNERYLPDNLNQHLGEFWDSGVHEANEVEKILIRYGFSNLSNKVCVEYGCGVGRVTSGLAKKFAQVHGYDISAGHLAQAQSHANEIGVQNISFHHCASNVLTELYSCDVFYSRIVFQHNPPPLISQLVRNALRSLKYGGIAIFQVPTYIVEYSFLIEKWLRTKHALDMQMHCIPQTVILDHITQQHCKLLELREDNSTGAPETYISNTFIVRKE